MLALLFIICISDLALIGYSTKVTAMVCSGANKMFV